MKTELHKVKLIMFPSIVNIKLTEKNPYVYIYVDMHNSKEVGKYGSYKLFISIL